MSSVGLSPRVFISEHPIEVKAGKFTYRRWVVQSSAKQYGKRIRRFAATRKEAEIIKAQLEDRISVDREKTANVEHGDRLDALKALEVLTGRATLTEAAQFWIDHHPDKRTDPFTQQRPFSTQTLPNNDIAGKAENTYQRGKASRRPRLRRG